MAIFDINAKYQVHVNEFTAFQHSSLFSSIEFFRLHSSSAEDLFFQLVRISDQQVIAVIPFYEVEKKIFKAPKKGTYANVDSLIPLSFNMLSEFLQFIDAHFQSLDAISVFVRLPPSSHDPTKHSYTFNQLTQLGFNLDILDINFNLAISNQPYEEIISYSARKKLHKCESANFYPQILSDNFFDEAYNVIVENRAKFSQSVSMNALDLRSMLNLFPQSFHLFGLFEDTSCELMIASAFCIEVEPHILYIFYWGDKPGFEEYSSITLLSKFIYDFAKLRSFSLLDAGISTSSGKPNLGLINYKTNLGFSASTKELLVKNYLQKNDSNS